MDLGSTAEGQIEGDSEQAASQDLRGDSTFITLTPDGQD